MILACSTCYTRFRVPEGAIGERGRTVKCAKCGHQWRAMPDEGVDSLEIPDEETSDLTATIEAENAAASEAKDSDFEAALEAALADTLATAAAPPRIKVTRKAMLSATAIAASLLMGIMITGLFVFRDGFIHSFPQFYSAMGMENSPAFAFSDIAFEAVGAHTYDRYSVTGKIVNLTDQDQPIPLLRVALQDAAGETFVSREYSDENIVKAGEAYPFRLGRLETSFKDRTARITVDMGNTYELKRR